ncbi:ABC transporter substrate-binding protein [Kocuria massiliensis]|uniref:ABC transporter substrate-binding protein n=1 Tax=Kocuria massiliensis TaxID=1926282 RepID=UPI0022B99C3E|nr:ABC transporter substrate-binding protein [Kocuria massiliensis]
MKKTSFSLVVAATGLLLASCSAPSGQESAHQTSGDGDLKIACSQQEIFCQKMTDNFTQATGIKATYVRLGSGEVLARLKTNKGEFDVWSGGQAENHIVAHKDGNIEPYVSPNAAKLPSEYNDPDGVWSGFYTDSIGFCSSKDELARLGADAPKSWDDLLDPKFEGKISMPHPATAGVGYMVLYTLNQKFGGDEGKVLDYMQKLNKNVVQYSKSAATSTQMVGRGEAAVGIALDSDCAQAQHEGFGSLENTYPEGGTGFEVGSVSIVKGAKHMDQAKKYFDWILSKEAQEKFAEVPSFAAPTNPEVTIGSDVPDQTKVSKVSWNVADAAGKRQDLNTLFEEKIQKASEAK